MIVVPLDSPFPDHMYTVWTNISTPSLTPQSLLPCLFEGVLSNPNDLLYPVLFHTRYSTIRPLIRRSVTRTSARVPSHEQPEHQGAAGRQSAKSEAISCSSLLGSSWGRRNTQQASEGVRRPSWHGLRRWKSQSHHTMWDENVQIRVDRCASESEAGERCWAHQQNSQIAVGVGDYP